VTRGSEGTQSRRDKASGKPEFVISMRPGIDWFSLGTALLIGVVFRYVNLRIPW